MGGRLVGKHRKRTSGTLLGWQGNSAYADVCFLNAADAANPAPTAMATVASP